MSFLDVWEDFLGSIDLFSSVILTKNERNIVRTNFIYINNVLDLQLRRNI